MQPFGRITFSPDRMGGRPCIRDLRVTVGMIVCQIAEGVSIDDFLRECPYLEREDTLQALRFAPWLASERELPLAAA